MLARGPDQPLSYNHVYSIGNLLAVLKLPATVQLIIGPKPRTFDTRTTGKAKCKSYTDISSMDGDMFTAVLRLDEIRVGSSNI